MTCRPPRFRQQRLFPSMQASRRPQLPDNFMPSLVDVRLAQQASSGIWTPGRAPAIP